jgi:hypothetical protein
MSGALKAVTGVIFYDDPDRGQWEVPTFTCPHCMTVGRVSANLDGVGGDDGGWCFPCGRLLCKRDRCHGECVPFLRAYADSHKDKNLRRVI